MRAPEKSNCVGWIVAGGRGMRMGGVDKCLLSWHGQSLLARTADTLRPQVNRCLLNANGDKSRFYPDHWPNANEIVEDAHPLCGPLGGIHAGLAYLQDQPEQWLLTCASDCPHIAPDLLSRFASTYHQGQRLFLARSPSQPQPLFGLWHQSLLTQVQGAIKDGQLKLKSLAHALAAQWVDFDSDDYFTNFNRPEDLAGC